MSAFIIIKVFGYSNQIYKKLRIPHRTICNPLYTDSAQQTYATSLCRSLMHAQLINLPAIFMHPLPLCTCPKSLALSPGLPCPGLGTKLPNHVLNSRKLNNFKSDFRYIRLKKNIQEPNFFCWIRSTAVMEAHFPRKSLATHRASLPQVVLLALLNYPEVYRLERKFDRLSITLSASDYCPYLF